MTKTTTAIGSISSGTLNNAELIETFGDTLRRLTSNPAHIELIAEANRIDPADDDAGELVIQLAEALDEFSPAYCYFGAHPGDGADFGFWPSFEAINELPCVGDPSEVEGFGEDCRFVNDHGNVTVYAADGSIIFDLV